MTTIIWFITGGFIGAIVAMFALWLFLVTTPRNWP